jgi:hypothetical protein
LVTAVAPGAFKLNVTPLLNISEIVAARGVTLPAKLKNASVSRFAEAL